MKTIEATYRIVTPMFIGGADGKPADGIRPPSFKGALRFWWRALNWGRFFQQENENEANALKALHKEEGRLFGSSASVENGKMSGGQGVFLLRINQPESCVEDNVWPPIKPLAGSGYLGMGLWESGSKDKNNFQAHRTSFFSAKPFKAEILFKSGISETDIHQLRQALIALGLFGGLGSRSRRGFGSVAILSIGGESFECQNTGAYQKHIRTLLQGVTEYQMIPPFTAWSPYGRVVFLKARQKTAKDAHKQAAQLFYKIRGRKAEVRGTAKRGFGQPLPLIPARDEYNERRASPLLFHIHPVGTEFVASHTFMPAEFLPNVGIGLNFYGGVSKYMDKLEEVNL